MRIRIFLLLFLASAGCSAASQKMDAAAVAELRTGQTTYDEVVRRYGRPNFVSKNWDGTRTASYAWAEGRSSAGLTLPALGAVVGGGSGGADSVVLYFDERGVLRDYKANAASASSSPGPTTRYVEPGAGGAASTAEVKSAQAVPASATPAVASGPLPAGQGVPAPPAAAKSEAQRQPAARPREDGLPWWLPARTGRDERN